MTCARGKKFIIAAIVLAVLCIGLGVYLTFFRDTGFEKTEATILSVADASGDAQNAAASGVTVKYAVNGVVYKPALAAHSLFYKEGKTVTLLYDPRDPAAVHVAGHTGLWLMALGGVLFLASIVVAVAVRPAEPGREEAPSDEPAPAPAVEEGGQMPVVPVIEDMPQIAFTPAAEEEQFPVAEEPETAAAALAVGRRSRAAAPTDRPRREHHSRVDTAYRERAAHKPQGGKRLAH